MVFAVLFGWVAFSLGSAVEPGLGQLVRRRAAEWMREHGGSSLVVWAENEWYSHHPPKVGGSLAPGAIRTPKSVTTLPAAVTVQHLPAPAPIVPLASPPVAGEGQWSPAGRLSRVCRRSTSPCSGQRHPYELRRRRRLDGHHTARVDPVLGQPDPRRRTRSSHTAPVSPSDATSLVAAFNAGFLIGDAEGGYYTDGKTVAPLRTGAASFVVYQNGNSTVGQWGRDVSMGPDVVSVRQNLDLLVDGGQVVPAAYTADPTQWGATLGGADYVWRSGSGSPPTVRWSTWAVRASTSPTWRRSWSGQAGARHGARHQHGLGELQHLQAVHHDRGGVGGQRHGAAVRHDRDSRRLLRALVGRDFITMSARSTVAPGSAQ